jgi:hypothetical protein
MIGRGLGQLRVERRAPQGLNDTLLPQYLKAAFLHLSLSLSLLPFVLPSNQQTLQLSDSTQVFTLTSITRRQNVLLRQAPNNRSGQHALLAEE